MNLTDHPNQMVATTNDDDAKALLKELGVLEKMEKAGMPESILPRQAFRLDMWNHPTHWITAMRYKGFERPEDNGFAVRCLPKSIVSMEAFKAELEREKKQEFTEIITEQTNDFPPTGMN